MPALEATGVVLHRLDHLPWKSVAADIDIFFCDPHAPWQRGTNENMDGLLRQYFPKGSGPSGHSAADLDWIAAELNDRLAAVAAGHRCDVGGPTKQRPQIRTVGIDAEGGGERVPVVAAALV